MSVPDRVAEMTLHGPVAGIDEAGRGCLCAPVVAAAVILPWHVNDDVPEDLAGVKDSKMLAYAARTKMAIAIRKHCIVGVGEASAEEIDERNILQATFLAMIRAVQNLATAPNFALIDGNRVPKQFPCKAIPIVKGDQSCMAIAAASIIAKDRRDSIMRELDGEFPGYGWSSNMGYGTKEHREAIKSLGVTRHHRRTFAGVKEHLQTEVPQSSLFA